MLTGVLNAFLIMALARGKDTGPVKFAVFSFIGGQILLACNAWGGALVQDLIIGVVAVSGAAMALVAMQIHVIRVPGLLARVWR